MTDESYIQLAIEIAKKGKGSVSPDPLVGCVIVKDDRILSAGFFEKYGGPHAESNAINSSNDNLIGSTMFINIEPCWNGDGNPSCVDEIIKNKINRVVIGTLDMNPQHSGKGIKQLKDAGIEVKAGVLENECVELNKFFFKFVTKKLPYITLKATQTIDGKIADSHRNSRWMSSISARRFAHSLRAKYDAVLIGSRTAEIDNPKLTVSLTEGRNPKRILIDSELSLSTKLKLFLRNPDRNLIVLTSESSKEKKIKLSKLHKLGAEVIFVQSEGRNKINLKSALKKLAESGITSVIVEGGSGLFTSFVKENLFDDILLFQSPRLLGTGLSLIGPLGIKSIKNAFKLKINSFEKIGEELLVEFRK